MKYRLRNPETGGLVELDADRVAEGLTDGLEPTEPLDLINPETQGRVTVAPDKLREAVSDGMLVPGSLKHRAGEMGTLEAGGRRLLQGASSGFSDEVVGALESLLTDKTYEQARDESRAANDAASEKLGGWGTALDIAGGVGTAMIPGLGPWGAASKGLVAGSAPAVARAAIQGATSGAGYSKGDTLGEVVGDAAIGGLAAGTMEKVLPWAGQKLRNVVSKAKAGLADAVDPGVQRALAAGAGPKDLRAPIRDRLMGAGKALNEIGAFKGGDLVAVTPDPVHGVKLEFDTSKFSARPDRKALDLRLEQVENVVGKQIGDLYRAAAEEGHGVNVYEAVLGKSVDDLDTIIRNASPGSEGSVDSSVMRWLERMETAGDDMQELHRIKQSLVRDAKFNTLKGEKNDVGKAATVLYGALNDAIKEELDNVAAQSNNTTLSRLNELYHSAASYRKVLDAGIAAEERQPRMLGFLKQNSATAGAMGATLGASAFGAPGAGIGATAGQVLDQMINATEGRLARAEAGERIAAAFGKIPRSSKAVRDAITQNPRMFLPLMGPELWQAVQSMPAHAWEAQARVLMPLLDQAGVFEDSEFKSELDGKVGEADKLPAMQRMEEQKLSPGAEFLRRNALIKNGELPPELQPQTAEQIMQRMQRDALPLNVFGQNM